MMSAGHRDRFVEACQVLDFAPNALSVGCYDVWSVQQVRDGQRVTVDGPYFTEQEARISADLIRSLFRGARASLSSHSWAWNPDPRREKAIRDDALASRMMLAQQLGCEVPGPGRPTGDTKWQQQ